MGNIAGSRKGLQTYPGRGESGTPGGGVAPLSRQWFIDGDRAASSPDGSVSAPYTTIAQFMAARGDASVGDATAVKVGWVMPALAGYTANVAFPAYVSTELRGESFSTAPGRGTHITGDVTWANVAGAIAADPFASVVLHNLSVTGSITITDDAEAPLAQFVYGADETSFAGAVLIGSITASATTRLASVTLNNVTVSGNVDLGTAADSAGLVAFNSTIAGDIDASSLTAVGSSFGSASIQIGDSGNPSFVGCQFSQGSNPTLTSGVGIAQFDGPSWASFSEAGGGRGAGTVVLIVGGYLAGNVEGALLPTSGTTNVSLSGSGATAGYTGENCGNHYRTLTMDGDGTVNLLIADALRGDTILITKSGLDAFSLTVVNDNGSNTIGVIPSGSRGFVLARFDGSNWIFEAGGALAA